MYFLKILLNESGQEVLEHYINSFSEKKFVQGKWTNLGPKIVHPHNSGSILRFFLKFCTMKRAKRYTRLIYNIFFF